MTPDVADQPVPPCSRPPLTTTFPGSGSGSGSGPGSEPPEPRPSVYSSRLGEPLPGEVTTPVVAVETIASATCEGEAEGLACRYSAAAPATCGDAIEVPEIVLVALSEVYQAEVMLLPGAKRSRQLPQLEKLDRASLLVVEPTVMAAAARAGEV